MPDFIFQSWPWWFSGIVIGLVVPALHLLAGKSFGISTSLQQIGAMCTAGRGPSYLKDFDRQKGMWTVVFIAGIALGGFVGSRFLTAEPVVFLPESYHSVGGAIRLLIGGFCVGFGARYAGGCTSGHAISGISNLNWPSLLATASFFAGGLAVTWGLGSVLF